MTSFLYFTVRTFCFDFKKICIRLNYICIQFDDSKGAFQDICYKKGAMCLMGLRTMGVIALVSRLLPIHWPHPIAFQGNWA